MELGAWESRNVLPSPRECGSEAVLSCGLPKTGDFRASRPSARLAVQAVSWPASLEALVSLVRGSLHGKLLSETVKDINFHSAVLRVLGSKLNFRNTLSFFWNSDLWEISK